MSGLIALALRLLLALALYAFLGWALWTLWRDIQREADRIVTRRAPGISLAVQKSGQLTAVKYFIQPEINLGRDPVCDIPIIDETVSARHARLVYHHSQWWLEDLNSTNGTRLNQVLVTTPTVLTSADEIDLGQIRITVSITTETPISSTKRLME
ncbi:MAG TPA: FHA domain-containing protein [Anaerolineales bacterium]